MTQIIRHILPYTLCHPSIFIPFSCHEMILSSLQSISCPAYKPQLGTSDHEMPQTAQNRILCPDTQRTCPKLPRRGA